MTDQQIVERGRRLLPALCRSGAEDLQPLPAPGHVVSFTVWRDETREGAEPLLREHLLWGEDGPQVLDDAAYAGYVDPVAGPRDGVFLHFLDVTPGWGGWLACVPDDDGTGWSDPSGPVAGSEHAWSVRHTFGGLCCGRRLFNGVEHRIHLQGDEVVVDESDLWFM